MGRGYIETLHGGHTHRGGGDICSYIYELEVIYLWKYLFILSKMLEVKT